MIGVEQESEAQDMPRPVVSICVVAHNEATVIERALRSLMRQSFSEPFEILVVDNASTDETVERASRALSSGCPVPWKIIRRSVNHLGLGRQSAVDAARAPLVAFTDADCEAPEVWLRNLVEGFRRSRQRDPRYIAVGSANRPPPSNRSGDRFHAVQSLAFTSVVGNFGSEQVKTSGLAGDVGHLPTCSVLYDKSALIRVGGFSSSRHKVCEDVDLSYRLKAVGGRLMKLSGSEVIHHHQPSYQAWGRKIFRYGWGQIGVMRTHSAHRKLRFLAPPLFVIMFPASLTFDMRWGAAWSGLYFAFILATSGLMARRHPTLIPGLAAFFAVTHFAYGLGLIAGVMGYQGRRTVDV